PSLPQLKAQCLPRPCEPRLHCSDGDTERIRNFVVTETVYFAKDNRRALIEGQAVERRLEPGGEFVLGKHSVRTGLCAGPDLAMGGDVHVERDLIGPVAPTPETVPIAGLVDGDAVNPGAQG